MHVALRMYAVSHYTRIGHGGGGLHSMESLKYLKGLNQNIFVKDLFHTSFVLVVVFVFMFVSLFAFVFVFDLFVVVVACMFVV